MADIQNNTLINDSGQAAVSVKFRGQNNYVEIGRIENLQSLTIDVQGDGNSVRVQRSPRFGTVRMLVRDASLIEVGEHTTIEGAYFLARDGAHISIGKDCMISFQVNVRTSDAHGIYDLESGSRLNAAQDVEVGDHVWIGQGAMLSKGAKVGSGAVVGYGAYVQKVYVSPNSMVVGAPAREVRRGVIWDRRSAENIYTCSEDEIDPLHLSSSDLLRRRRNSGQV